MPSGRGTGYTNKTIMVNIDFVPPVAIDFHLSARVNNNIINVVHSKIPDGWVIGIVPI